MAVTSLLVTLVAFAMTVQVIYSIANPGFAQLAVNNSESSSLLLRIEELLATGVQNQTGDDASSLKQYNSSAYNVSIKYPEGWIPSTYGMRHYSDLIGFYSPLENLSDTFPVKGTISMLIFSQDISLDRYTNSTLTALNASRQIDIKDSGPFILSGYPGYAAVLEYNDTQNRNITFTTVNIWTVVKQGVYALTYEGESSKVKLHLPEFARMVESFRIGANE
jgi:hypothetical protein